MNSDHPTLRSERRPGLRTGEKASRVEDRRVVWAELERNDPWARRLVMSGFKLGGFWDKLFTRLCQSRRIKWASFYRACKRIPKSSPVHGSTSWKRINHRRHELIEMTVKTHEPKKHPVHGEEFRILQSIPVGHQSIICQNFVMGRLLRRLEAKDAKQTK